MKFLADENLPNSIIQFFKKRGYDIRDIKTTGWRQISDKSLAALAEEESRVIVTYDKDFLAPVGGKRLGFSAVVLNFPGMSPRQTLPYIALVLDQLSAQKIKQPFVVLVGLNLMRIIR